MRGLAKCHGARWTETNLRARARAVLVTGGRARRGGGGGGSRAWTPAHRTAGLLWYTHARTRGWTQPGEAARTQPCATWGLLSFVRERGQ